MLWQHTNGLSQQQYYNNLRYGNAQEILNEATDFDFYRELASIPMTYKGDVDMGHERYLFKKYTKEALERIATLEEREKHFTDLEREKFRELYQKAKDELCSFHDKFVALYEKYKHNPPNFSSSIFGSILGGMVGPGWR